MLRCMRGPAAALGVSAAARLMGAAGMVMSRFATTFSGDQRQVSRPRWWSVIDRGERERKRERERRRDRRRLKVLMARSMPESETSDRGIESDVAHDFHS